MDALWPEAAGLYRGTFLDEREVELPRAEGLRRRLLRQVVRVARHCERGNRQEAVDWHEEALHVDPCAEDVCRSLMTACHRLGRADDAAAAYPRCRSARAALKGLVPNPLPGAPRARWRCGTAGPVRLPRPRIRTRSVMAWR